MNPLLLRHRHDAFLQSIRFIAPSPASFLVPKNEKHGNLPQAPSCTQTLSDSLRNFASQKAIGEKASAA